MKKQGEYYPLILHRRRNNKTDIKQSLPYGKAPGIECQRVYMQGLYKANLLIERPPLGSMNP